MFIVEQVYIIIDQDEKWRSLSNCKGLGVKRITVIELKLRQVAGSFHVCSNRLETLVISIDLDILAQVSNRMIEYFEDLDWTVVLGNCFEIGVLIVLSAFDGKELRSG